MLDLNKGWWYYDKTRFFNPSIVNNYHFVNFTSGGLMNKKTTSN